MRWLVAVCPLIAACSYSKSTTSSLGWGATMVNIIHGDLVVTGCYNSITVTDVYSWQSERGRALSGHWSKVRSRSEASADQCQTTVWAFSPIVDPVATAPVECRDALVAWELARDPDARSKQWTDLPEACRAHVATRR